MDLENPTRHVLQGKELIDYLVEKAATTTNAELLQREERRSRRLTLAFSLISLMGFGAIVGAIKLFVQQEIAVAREDVAYRIKNEVDASIDRRLTLFEKRAQETVATQINGQVSQVRKELELFKQSQELAELSKVIQAKVSLDEFPMDQVETALKMVKQFASDDSIRWQSRYVDAAKTLIDLLVRTDRKRDIDELHQLLGDVFVTDRKITLDLTDHYGQLIIASPYDVADLPAEYEALTLYAQASRQLKYPEKALMWELFVAYKGNGYTRSATTDSMVEMIQDLNAADTRNFFYHLFLNSDPLYWMNEPDQEGRALQRLVSGLIRDYPYLREAVESQIDSPELKPLIEKLVAKKMRRMEALQMQPTQPTTPTPEVATGPEPANALRR